MRVGTAVVRSAEISLHVLTVVVPMVHAPVPDAGPTATTSTFPALLPAQGIAAAYDSCRRCAVLLSSGAPPRPAAKRRQDRPRVVPGNDHILVRTHTRHGGEKRKHVWRRRWYEGWCRFCDTAIKLLGVSGGGAWR